MPNQDASKTEPVVLPISRAKNTLTEVVNRVHYTGCRVRLTRRGKVVAEIVPVADEGHEQQTALAS